MKSRKQQASRAAIDLIKRFEGYRRAAARLPDGRWTIGYGHTKTARPGAEVSEGDAEALLIYDLMEVSGALHECVYTPLTQNQFDALAAFVFNIGAEAFRRSVVLRRLNEGALLQAAYAMELWRCSEFEGESIVVDALVRRRAAEKVLFLTPPDGFVPAPSQILRPAFDAEAGDRAPADSVEVAASLEGEEVTAERIGPLPTFKLSGEEPRSATEIAAAALTARLDAILKADESAGPDQAAEPAPEIDDQIHDLPQPLERLESADESPDAPEEPASEPTREPAGETADAPLEPELFAPIPGVAETVALEPPRASNPTRHRERERRLTGLAPMLALGGIGLVMFAAGLFWSFNAKRAADDGLFTGAWMAGLTVGLVGIACMAVAIYFLLDRLGGQEDEEQA